MAATVTPHDGQPATHRLLPRIGWEVRPDGCRLRLARWPRPKDSRASALLIQGRSEFIEKYHELAADLLARGIRVISFDLRGQGHSDRPLTNRQIGHVKSFDDHLDDIDRVLALDAPDRGEDEPLLLIGHSLGGHLGLRYLAERGAQWPIAAGLFSAPAVTVRTGPFPGGLTRMLARRRVRGGRGERYAWTQADWRAKRAQRSAPLLSGDPVRNQMHWRAFVEDTDLQLGGVSWGWLNALFDSQRRLEGAVARQPPKVPLVIALAGREQLIDNAAIRRVASKLPQATLRSFRDARHELFMERDAIRDVLLDDIDRLAAEAAASEPPPAP